MLDFSFIKRISALQEIKNYIGHLVPMGRMVSNYEM